MSGYESPDPQTEWTGDAEQAGDASGGDRPIDPGTPDVTDPSGVPIDPDIDPDLAVGAPSDGDATGGADPGTPADMGADDELTVDEGAGRPRGNPPVPDGDRPITE